jgi:hypothetical protein
MKAACTNKDVSSTTHIHASRNPREESTLRSNKSLILVCRRKLNQRKPKEHRD